MKILKFFKILSKKEKFYFFCFLLISFISLFYLFSFLTKKFTVAKADFGGEIKEGILGTPNFLLPVYDPLSEPDRNVTQLIFSQLFKYDGGKLVPNLVKKYEILPDGKGIDFELKDNIFWQDGEKITSADVVFTINLIQNPEVKSPLAPLWVGITPVEISEKRFRLEFKKPYLIKDLSNSFLVENLTLKIIPKHVFEKIPLNELFILKGNFPIVASGPFTISKIIKDNSGKIREIEFLPNKKYFGKKPYLQKIIFKFFDLESDLILALRKKEIDSFLLSYFQSNFSFKNLKSFRFLTPRYYAIFFNLEDELFSQKAVREALSLSTDKREIFEKVFQTEGKIVNSPILADIYHVLPPKNFPKFDLRKAKEVLEKDGFFEKEGRLVKILKEESEFRFKSDLKLGSLGDEVKELQKCLKKEGFFAGEINGIFDRNLKAAVIVFQEKYFDEILKPAGLKSGNGKVGPATREKLNKICFEKKEKEIELKFTLLTIKEPVLEKIANLLKKNWEKIGAKVEVEFLDQEKLKIDVLPKKSFQVILLGESYGKILDPYPYWHSSQAEEFGLNFSKYKNKEMDKLIENLKKSSQENERKEILEKIQDILIKDMPAIFLINPYHFYFVPEKLKGIENRILFDVSERFQNIENWYIKEKRF